MWSVYKMQMVCNVPKLIKKNRIGFVCQKAVQNKYRSEWESERDREKKRNIYSSTCANWYALDVPAKVLKWRILLINWQETRIATDDIAQIDSRWH